MINRTKCSLAAFAILAAALTLPFLRTSAHADDAPTEHPEPQVPSETKIYDINDLIQQIHDIKVSSGGDGISTVDDLPRSATGLFTDSGMATALKSRDDAVKEIVDTIKATIAQDSWRDAGGNIGSLREFNGNLIVVQSPRAHDQIKQLLASLRAKRETPLQFEEQVIAVDQKTLTAITEMGPTLSTKQVAALLADPKIKLLASPRSPLLSGHYTQLYQSSSRSFVQSFRHTADNADASATQPSAAPIRDMLEPVIGNIEAASSTDAKATLAADHDTVTIHFRQHSTKPKLSPARTIPGKAGDKGFTTESPELETHGLDTTFTVPEGAYAVLGGNRLLPPGSDKDIADADNPFILYLVRASIVAPPKP